MRHFSIVIGMWLAICCFGRLLKADREIEAVIDSLRLNSYAIKSFDVLIEGLTFADKEELGAESSRILTRIVCDRDAKRCLQIRVGERLIIEANEQGGFQKRESVVATTTLIDDKQIDLVSGRRRAKMASENFPAALSKAEILMVDFVGILPFPVFLVPDSVGGRNLHAHELRDELWARARAELARFRRVAVAPVPTYTFESKNTQGRIRHEKLICDDQTLLPLQRSVVFKDSVSNTKTDETPDWHRFFTWTEVAGVFVPSEISEDSLQLATADSGKRISYELNVSYKLHWFGVNLKVDDKIFQSEMLDDPQKQREFVDPKLAGATSLFKEAPPNKQKTEGDIR